MKATRAQALLPFAFSLVPFLLLATANSAGYRYGASDLAFYGPAVMRHLDPELFPRDRVVIDAQARLTLMDETVGTLARMTTDNFPLLFLVLYLATLVLIAAGATAIGESIYRHQWATVALLAALTLRHAIPRSGANTLEAYFHPRQLAFAFGTLAIAAFLRGRAIGVIAALGGAALLHPTTTLWLAIWLGIAIFVSEPRWRAPLGAVTLVGILVVAWGFFAGPLAGRLHSMDDEWLAAMADKEYLFPLRWPISVWTINLGYVPLIWLIHRWRSARNLLVPRETALVLGCLSLVPVFLVAVSLHAVRVALAIQLQPARVFWMLDFLAIVYVVWAVVDRLDRSALRRLAATAAIVAISVVRGAYVMHVEFPDRPLFEPRVPGPWGPVMAWARSTPRSTGWLADPNHAALYGTSLRMAAGRDVFVEALKDSAIGMYDRTIALRTRDRLRMVDNFAALGVERARQIALEHGLDYLVAEREMPLPLVFRSGSIRVYSLR